MNLCCSCFTGLRLLKEARHICVILLSRHIDFDIRCSLLIWWLSSYLGLLYFHFLCRAKARRQCDK